MNYYHRHLGDYAKDTTLLTMLQHGAYNLLIDRYYVSEIGIPADEVYAVAKAATKDERKATDYVLKKFFTLKAGTWIKDRCEEEIEKAHIRIAAARANGLKGGNPNRPDPAPQGQPTGLPTGETLQSPISNPKSLRKESETKNGLSESRREEFGRFLASGVQRIAK